MLKQKAAEEDKFNRELAAKLDTDKTWTKNGTTYWKTLKEGTGNPCPDNACRYTLTALKTFDHTGKATDVKTAPPRQATSITWAGRWGTKSKCSNSTRPNPVSPRTL